MLKQAQKKIMSVKDFTNRLTFFTNALEECARAYENTAAGDRIKRTDTRDGFGMLLFLPPKPTDDHQKMYDNIVCHWFYRQELEGALAQEIRARDELDRAEGAYAAASAGLKDAGELLSKAKQQLGEGEDSKPAVDEAQAAKQAAERELAEAREKRRQAKEALATAEKRRGEYQKELDRLLKERTKSSKGKSVHKDFAAFAASVRAVNGLPDHPADEADPACFDDVIGCALQAKDPTPTDISRLRTDASNSTILNEFIVANKVVSPTYAQAGFPACRTSLIRDTDPAFRDTVIQAARDRVMCLIAAPELVLGFYEDEGDRALLIETLGLSARIDCLRTTQGLQGASDASSEDAFAEEYAPENILFELVTSEAFPIMAEEMLKPAILEGLARFGDETAREDFSRKLTVLSYDEQLARKEHARAVDTPFSQPLACYARQLKARGEMLAFMLSTALLGASAVKSYPVNMENIQKIVTGQPNSMMKKAGKANASQAGGQALIVEQIPNQQGSFSFGKTIPLAKGAVLIGRAPFGGKQESIIVPAGISPYPGLADFAANVSRSHALLEPSEEGWLLSDAGSSFGTAIKRPGQQPSCIMLVDDEPILLQNGDIIVLAPIVYDDGSCDIDAHLGFSYRFELM